MPRRTPKALREHAAKMAAKKRTRAAPNYPYGTPARGKRYPSVGAKQIAKARARIALPASTEAAVNAMKEAEHV